MRKEKSEQKEYIRLYLDNLDGEEMYLEINWNKYAKKDNVLKIGIGDKKVVVDAGDLETILLAFTKQPQKFLKTEYTKKGAKYVPVPIDQYRKWKKHRKYIKNKTGKTIHKNPSSYPTVA